MSQALILDTGPLVALLFRREQHHAWAKQQFGEASDLVTCEPVLAEAAYLLRNLEGGTKALMALVGAGIVRPVFRLAGEHVAVARLMEKYRDVPMSLADACLVRMAEQHDSLAVLTLDSDFGIYRKHGDQPIPVVTPGKQ